MLMSELEVFVEADQALLEVIEQIDDRQWATVLPDWFMRSDSQRDVSLRQLIEYHAYDEAWVPDMLAGRTMDEADKEKFSGDLLGDNPIANYRRLARAAQDAARSHTDLDRVVHCSFGDYPAREFLWQANYFRGIRAYDVAKLIGTDPHLSPALVQGLWEELIPHAEEWRTIGVFKKAVEVPEDASLLHRLVALTGRQP
jgi:uncharacterized protein (TIGR03086 family)